MKPVVGIYICPQVPQHLLLKTTTCGSQASPSNMWSPKSGLRSSGLTRALRHILPAQQTNVKRRQGLRITDMVTLKAGIRDVISQKMPDTLGINKWCSPRQN